MLRKCI